MKAKICETCGSRFVPTRSSQKDCKEIACRRLRKRAWQREKLHSDPDYRAAQRDSHAAWLAKNPDYYRNYRKTHPSYTCRNRLQQRIRNQCRRGVICDDSSEVIAKMDAKKPVMTGLYQLLAVEPDGSLIAKMEPRYVQLTELQSVTNSSP
jgi:hypothetical protein